MSNLFQRQLSQGDQVNLQSPLAIASMNQQNIQLKPVNGFSPTTTIKYHQNALSMAQNQYHTTSLTHTSSEASLMESSIAYQNMQTGQQLQQVGPYANYHQTTPYDNQTANKENSSPMFLRKQYSGTQNNENQQNTHEYINPTKLFTQEFLNQNKQKVQQQQNAKSPLSQRPVNTFSDNCQLNQYNQKGFDNQNSINARNDYFNSLKSNTQQQQQQYLQNQSGLGSSRDENQSDFSSNQTLYDKNNGKQTGQEKMQQLLGINSGLGASNTPAQFANNSSSLIYQNAASDNKQNVNFKIDPLDRPLSMLLENAINKAIYQSDRVIPSHPHQIDQQRQHPHIVRPSSDPEIPIQDQDQCYFSQQPSMISPNTLSNNSSLNNTYASKNAANQNYPLFQHQQSINPSHSSINYINNSNNNISNNFNNENNNNYNHNEINNYLSNENNLNNNSNNNINQNSIYIEENYQNRQQRSPINQQKSNLNNSTLSPNNVSNRPSYKSSNTRLTLVERQTLNKSSSRSPSKSSHHINCKFPNGDSNNENNKHDSKKKGQTYSYIHNNYPHQQQQEQTLIRSKSNNSIVPQHCYQKKSTTSGSPNHLSQNNMKYSTSNSKISNLDRMSQRSPQQHHSQNGNNHAHSYQSARVNATATAPHNRKDISPNFNSNKAQQNGQKQNSKLSSQKMREANQNSINKTQDNNHFVYHKQNISTIVPNLDFEEQQQQQQQQQKYMSLTPRSMSTASLNQSQNSQHIPQQQQQQQYQVQLIPYCFKSNIASQSPNAKYPTTPKGNLNNNSQYSQKSISFPNDIHQMQQIITNQDVQLFLKFHFLVGETTQRLICDSWHSIPLVYFIKLLITEFPEVLEDHQIGEALLTELKDKITLLVQDDDNSEFVNLFKLQTYTKTTGLLGLILKALKELSTEERSRLSNPNNLTQQKINSDREIILQQQQQGNSISLISQQGTNSFSLPLKQNFLENFKVVFQNSIEKNSVQYYLQSKDVQNIVNIIQEFVEGLYRDMENEIYSKFNVEMRRMMMKFKETEQLLKLASDKVTDNYGLFSQEACQVKKIKQLQGEKNELLEQNNLKDLQISKLEFLVEQLTAENTKLIADNDKLHQKCEQYLEFGMKNVQTIYQNNLQDQYQQLVQQQKCFFDQQIKQLEDYKLRQSLQKKDQPTIKSISNNKSHNPRHNTDVSDTESCNLSYALMTLEDQATPKSGPFQSSSKIPSQAIKALNQFEVHQNQNAFKRNKTEGQTLEPVMMNNSQFFDSSDKVSLFRALNIFLAQSQARDFMLPNRKQNTSCEYSANSPIQGFAVNATTITGRYGGQQRSNQIVQPMTVDQAIDKLQSLIEIVPLIREVRLFNYEQITNLLKYLYTLQMYIYQQVDYKEAFNSQDDITHQQIKHIQSIPMNKCWKKILAEHNNKDFFCSFMEQNQTNGQSFSSNQQSSSQPAKQNKTLQPSSSSSCLTPKSKPDIKAMQNIQNHMFEQNNDNNERSEQINSNVENRFHPNHLIINNQGIIDILIYVLNQHLQKIIQCEKQNQNSDAKTKYFLLKMLIYLNTLIISNNKNDIQNVLNRFFSEIKSQIHDPLISDFVRDNNVLDVIFLSLRSINFANTQTISEALQFLISFKQASSNYMAFIRQLSQENNMSVLLQLLECQFDSRNIMMTLNLIKNVSYSINFKENIQAKIKQVLDQIQQRCSDTQEKEIEDIAKVIRSNINCGVNIRTISLTPSQVNMTAIAGTVANKN